MAEPRTKKKTDEGAETAKPRTGQEKLHALARAALATTFPEQAGDAVRYRVLVPCRLGTFREPGEIVSWPRFAQCPRYLKELAPGEETASGAEAHGKQAPGGPGGTAVSVPGPTVADMFAGAR